jgi:lytic murein transglycosylase
MRCLRRYYAALTALLILTGEPGAALAVQCQHGSFEAWLAAFKREAAAAGISQRAIAAAFAGVRYDASVVRRDRSQGAFRQSFATFAGRRVTAGRVRRGTQLLAQNASLFRRIEQRFGVPGPVIVAIWGLETDFGSNNGRFPTIRSLATLAYDCRRSAFFQNELMNALRIVQRGDMSAGQMRGAWAGEFGQTQFMPSSFMKFAVDFDGNGRRDIIRSRADALASTANYLRGYGWQAGQSWQPGTANFAALKEWNKSDVYSRTIAYFADKLAGSRSSRER